jgi:hypothetical protein
VNGSTSHTTNLPTKPGVTQPRLEIVEISPRSPPSEQDSEGDVQQPSAVLPTSTESDNPNQKGPPDLEGKLMTLIDKSTEAAVLKMQAKTSQNELANRTTEFEKSISTD